MDVIVTGATGFVGRHVVSELVKNKHKVTAIARDFKKAVSMPWFKKVDFISSDIYHDKIGEHFPIDSVIELPRVLVHLAWDGLPNYKELYHFEKNLFDDYTFIRNMIHFGIRQILVAGTCFEYGLQEGELSENMVTNPVTAYGLAKDSLRKFIQELEKEYMFTLQWVRLFYMYGEGQNQNSVLAQLDRAIDRDKKLFNMSRGEQLRDYSPVEKIAKKIVLILEHPECSGVINCCSGRPISIRSLVERRIAERKASIKLNLGYYKYNDYEPMAFWGRSDKLLLFKSKKEII